MSELHSQWTGDLRASLNLQNVARRAYQRQTGASLSDAQLSDVLAGGLTGHESEVLWLDSCNCIEQLAQVSRPPPL